MTPDTAALRALADDATPGPWTYIGKGDFDTPPIDVDEADWGPEGHHGYRLRTWSDGTGWRNADVAYIAALDPDTVRALCDAADEVERLRCVHCGEVGCDWIGDIHKARADMAEAERDASRTAHAALDADLRALRADFVMFNHPADDRWVPWVEARDLDALLDRHAPTTGATP